MSEAQNVVKDAMRLDSASALPAAAAAAGVVGGLRPAADGVVNGPASYTFPDHAAVDSAILSSPNSRQQASEQNKNRRPLIGQGTKNAAEMPAPAAAANFGTLPQNVVTHAPVGRPIVKGNLVVECASDVINSVNELLE